MTKIYETWKDRIDSGRFTKGECLQWAQAVVPLSEEMRPSGKKTNLEPHEARHLRQMLAARPVLLWPEHTEQGRRWLERYAEKQGFPIEMDKFSHFSYAGDAHLIYNDMSDWVRGAAPIWHVHLTDGREFTYYATAWQSGESELWWQEVGGVTR